VTEVVLDASALLAFLKKEPGKERVDAALGHALMSSVNLEEVVSKAVDSGGSIEEASQALMALPMRIAPFTAEDAYISASLRKATRHVGLSLGERACLALALKLSVPALTTEGKWLKIHVGVRVEKIR
jgi:ribonuclease VapC